MKQNVLCAGDYVRVVNSHNSVHESAAASHRSRSILFSFYCPHVRLYCGWLIGCVTVRRRAYCNEFIEACMYSFISELYDYVVRTLPCAGHSQTIMSMLMLLLLRLLHARPIGCQLQFRCKTYIITLTFKSSRVRLPIVSLIKWLSTWMGASLSVNR